MPTNLYGPGDNYHPDNSHVIPALIRKFHEAKVNHQPTVTIWGSGTPRREFLYSDDMAQACLFLMQLPENEFVQLLAQDRNNGLPPLVNVGTGTDITIKQLAELVGSVVGYSGQLIFDSTKPDGTMRKLMDVSLINSLGWQAGTSFIDGMNYTYQNYKDTRGAV
jgi:GDP-L-fucose synthase